MIFSELYSSYYNAVAKILAAAANGDLTDKALREIVSATAFDESILTIESALKSEQWQLLHSDGTACTEHIPTMPLTTLQKRWIKAVYCDPRIRLFTDDVPAYLADVKPLFTSEDYCVFDRYSDGDDYSDERYIGHFRMILDAVKNERALEMGVMTRYGRVRRTVMLPRCIEYSEKDDKFRVTGDSDIPARVINIGRVVDCKEYAGDISHLTAHASQQDTVEFDLYDTRKALERAMMHFAHFEKEVVKTGDKQYHVTLKYEHNDETELLIRVLSFGPLIKVTAPKSFILLVKMRLERQKQYIPYAGRSV